MRERGSMLEQIAKIVGREWVRTGDDAAPWAVHGHTPRAVASPPSDEAAAALLALASAEGWRVELAGSGGCLTGGRVQDRVDLVVTTEALAGVHAHEPADLVATVGAGTTLTELADALAPHRQWLPLDPPDRGDATLGAVIAQASAGPLREAHGTPRDHVLGLRLITGDGRILDLGGRVVKNVAGYDLVRLAIGSRGTLGLITRLHIQLRPLPQRDETVTVSASASEALVELVAWLRKERIGVAALEMVGGDGVDGGGGTEANNAWRLLARLQGNAEAVGAMRDRIESNVTGTREIEIGEGLTSSGAAEEGAPWRHLSALEARADICIRLADLPSRLGDTLAAARELAGSLPGATILSHAGVGIVRVCSAAAEELSDSGLERLATQVTTVRERLAARRGTVLVVRAPRVLAERVGSSDSASDVMARLTRGLRSAFDPAKVLAGGETSP